MNWYAPPSIKAALLEANVLWPQRSRASDGTIGDAAHRARKSDHNPDGRGCVHAFDITHDPQNGCDAGKLVKLVVGRRDHRLRYAIWNRTITYGPHAESVKRGERRAWTSEPYRGSNPHTTHAHFSIGHTERCENDVSPWWSRRPEPDDKVSIPDPTLMLTRPYTRGQKVKNVQHALVHAGHRLEEDGVFGPATERALRAFQRAHGLVADGICGPLSWAALRRVVHEKAP